MSETFSMPGGGFVAEVTIEGNGVYATGRQDWPLFVFTLQMNFHGPGGPKRALDFRELRCRLIPFESGHIAISLPTPLQLRLRGKTHVPNQIVHLEVPLDRTRIASINRLRNGGDVRLKLDLELLADEVMEVGSIQGQPPVPIWALKDHYIVKAHG